MSHFLDLPGELRNRVYEFVALSAGFGVRCDRIVYPAVLLTCEQVKGEFQPMFEAMLLQSETLDAEVAGYDFSPLIGLFDRGLLRAMPLLKELNFTLRMQRQIEWANCFRTWFTRFDHSPGQPSRGSAGQAVAKPRQLTFNYIVVFDWEHWTAENAHLERREVNRQLLLLRQGLFGPPHVAESKLDCAMLAAIRKQEARERELEAERRQREAAEAPMRMREAAAPEDVQIAIQTWRMSVMSLG